MRLETVTTTTPNNSGIIVLLTVAVLVNRTPFWSDPAGVVSLHKKVVGTYIIEHQRNNLFSHLKAKLELLEPSSSKKNMRSKWGKQEGSAQSDKTPDGKQIIRVFKASREDHLNKVTLINPVPMSPPKMKKTAPTHPGRFPSSWGHPPCAEQECPSQSLPRRQPLVLKFRRADP